MVNGVLRAAPHLRHLASSKDSCWLRVVGLPWPALKGEITRVSELVGEEDEIERVRGSGFSHQVFWI